MSKKVAAVTGASRGIGRAIALELAKEGMNVIVNYLNSEDEAFDLVKEINVFSNAIAIKADVSDIKQVKALLDKAINTFGQVDVLINNAGAIFRDGDWQGISEESWNNTIDTNLKGNFNCIKTFAPIFLKQKYGRIVNITSTFGIMGAAGVIAYTAAKAGIINMTKSFAKEFAPYITVNAIAPGIIDTVMTTGAGEELVNSFIDSTPLKRLGRPEEIAYAISFLVSPKADFITGHVLVVDGGQMLK